MTYGQNAHSCDPLATISRLLYRGNLSGKCATGIPSVLTINEHAPGSACPKIYRKHFWKFYARYCL